MCLRSVHSLLSLRFGGGSSCLTAIHPSLHCVQFISPTSAPHDISGFLIPPPKSTHTFHFALRMLLSSHVDTLHFMPGINNQPNKASSKASFHIHPLCRSTQSPPMPFPCAFPMVYFSYCGVLAPIKRLKAERLVITPNR